MRHRNDVPFRAHTVWDNADHAETSSLHGNWYVNEMGLFETFATSDCYKSKSDQFETSQLRSSWYLSETDQFKLLAGRLNWYLNETDVFEMLCQLPDIFGHHL